MPAKSILAALLVVWIWGANFVVIKVGLEHFPPLFMSGVRFLLAAVPAVFFIPKPAIGWRYIVLTGFILGIVKFSLLFVGMDIGASAGMASILIQTQAFFTALFAFFLLKEKLSPAQIAGILVAFTGVWLLADSATDAAGGGNTVLGLTMVMGAAVIWSTFNILMKMVGGVNILHLIVWMSLIPPLPLFAMSYFLETPARIEAAFTQISLGGIAAVIYLAFLATVAAYAIWGRLLQLYPANLVAPFSLLIPVVGMFSSWLFLGETFSPTALMATCLILVGLVINLFGNRFVAGLQRAFARPKAEEEA